MKTMKIEILDKKQANDDLLKAAKDFDKKHKRQKFSKNTTFESLAAVRKVLTDKRLEVWRAIRDLHPKSISALAKLLDREFRAVHRDVILLKEIGLISIKEISNTRGTAQELKSNYDELLLAVA
ncbi:MAG: hypothetical protein A2504_07500 [Bdellovibrionales bacterium RIFOXYD12_FULL_39_22]|nr:MAG: hypothetical protein A2385_16865 [Bdellovibrionales bacterium RIFOXYB1_FULL_39_21]OFZ44721.1 MAG: hypothetical protein A2485_14730 [Bdellovibrionales bacterium RIFOXYC12_FULL_39_17]OFZ49350.1 MAG: hypothetical protein A2404_09020 [Bdellovibrionales bacterium RIFOXYC1_FULL_39_130]OFZ77087.1 MAG: hypothetical protein A2560_09990 [Bdellovibrionales bacterium RIFOXYD1_FULL_39_84]OFZ95347.1 MAG: hypothetical protein A2504_07500 [Bdellovibrionales bacterium RIFOXYD12_FULL_39_22]HLE13036.1 hy